MAMVASSSEKEFELCPAVVCVGTCVWVIDLGMQLNTYKDEMERRVKLWFELSEKDSENRPFMVSSKPMKFSTNPKSNMCQMLVAWRGKEFTPEEKAAFDLKNILGKSCQLNVVHVPSQDGTTTYANIGSIMPIMKGTPVPALHNELIFYDTESHVEAVWEKIPDGIKDKINRLASSVKKDIEDYPPVEQPSDFDDEVPF